MESVLLTTSVSFPNDVFADKYAAVKIDEFYLATGSAFAPLFSLTNSDSNSALDIFREREFRAILQISKPVDQTFEVRRIFCIAIHDCKLIEQTLDCDLRDLEFKNPVDRTSKLNYRTFGMFVLFSENSKHADIGKVLHKIYDHLLPINRSMVGNVISVVSTPFKNLSLFNSYSQGIICNVFGKDQCLFLVDVKLSQGCEGSPVFSTRNELIGLVMNVFTWFKGEWTGFSIAVHLYPVLISWLKSSLFTVYPCILEKHSFIGDYSVDSYGVVIVSTPYKWGSGVIVNKERGIVVTCSHVVDFTVETSDVTIEYNGILSKGEVLYATSENFPFDIAVIKVDMPDFKGIVEFKPSTKAIKKGDAVYVIAYPLLSFRKHSVKGPSVTYGHVSNVYSNIMILTTCATNSGASGGALVRSNGELLGIVANNVVVPTENLLIPHITVAIPSSVFLQPVERYCSTDDPSELNCLTTEGEHVRDIWQLSLSGKFMTSKL